MPNIVLIIIGTLLGGGIVQGIYFISGLLKTPEREDIVLEFQLRTEDPNPSSTTSYQLMEALSKLRTDGLNPELIEIEATTIAYPDPSDVEHSFFVDSLWASIEINKL